MTAAGAGTQRQCIEALLDALPHRERIRGQDSEVSFDAAWELRAVALAVAGHQGGHYDWQRFQQALIAAIQRWEASESEVPWRYYDRWLEALESVLAEAGMVAPSEVDDRAHAVLTTPRDADHHRARRDPVTVDPGR